MTNRIRPGQIFAGRFTVAEVFEGGGMADVFRASDPRTRRVVVIKSQREDDAGDAFRKRFEREVEVLGAVQHPFVLPLFETGMLPDERVWFAIPFVRDRCVVHQIEGKKRPFSHPELLQLGLEICEALGAVHGAGWVHRDVKPANILVSGRHFMLADFGIATRAGATDHGTIISGPPGGGSQSRDTLTATGAVMGTAEFLSPERFDGNAASPADDCFALAVLLYKLFVDADPFDHVAGNYRYGRMLAKPPTDPRVRAPALSTPLAEFLLRGLDCTRDNRFATAEQMRHALLAASAVRVDGRGDGSV